MPTTKWPAEGFYRLTRTVKNPMPRDSAARICNRLTWSEGLLVYVKRIPYEPREEARGYVAWDDGSASFFGGNSLEMNRGDAVLKHLKPERPTLGRRFEKMTFTTDVVLAALIAEGKVRLDDVLRMDEELQKRPPKEVDRFCKKNRLDVWLHQILEGAGFDTRRKP
jgi:hypothetical protein